jgi:hypothetical protein
VAILIARAGREGQILVGLTPAEGQRVSCDHERGAISRVWRAKHPDFGIGRSLRIVCCGTRGEPDDKSVGSRDRLSLRFVVVGSPHLSSR